MSAWRLTAGTIASILQQTAHLQIMLHRFMALTAVRQIEYELLTRCSQVFSTVKRSHCFCIGTENTQTKSLWELEFIPHTDSGSIWWFGTSTNSADLSSKINALAVIPEERLNSEER